MNSRREVVALIESKWQEAGMLTEWTDSQWLRPDVEEEFDMGGGSSGGGGWALCHGGLQGAPSSWLKLMGKGCKLGP